MATDSSNCSLPHTISHLLSISLGVPSPPFGEYLSLNSGITQNAVLSPFLLPFYILSQDHLICYCNFNYHLHTDDSQKYIISPTVMTPDTYEYPTTYLLYITRHKLNLSINFSQTYSFGILPISNWPHQPPSCLHQKSGHLIIIKNFYPYLISIHILTSLLIPKT